MSTPVVTQTKSGCQQTSAQTRAFLLLPAGPVTILNWSFPRKDISRKVQAFQLALALRQEMVDLEAAGCKVIQVRDQMSSMPGDLQI